MPLKSEIGHWIIEVIEVRTWVGGLRKYTLVDEQLAFHWHLWRECVAELLNLLLERCPPIVHATRTEWGTYLVDICLDGLEEWSDHSAPLSSHLNETNKVVRLYHQIHLDGTHLKHSEDHHQNSIYNEMEKFRDICPVWCEFTQFHFRILWCHQCRLFCTFFEMKDIW